jgi:hypothetical protein
MAESPYRERLLLVTVNWSNPPTPAKLDKLKDLFNSALHWANFAPNSWILRTNNNADYWFPYIDKHLEAGDAVFICELDKSPSTKYSGRMPPWFWDWWKKY